MFNVFKKVLGNKPLTDEDVSKVSDFVMCRWLSGNAGTIQIAQMFNVYHKIPIDVKLKVLQKMIGGRIKYIPYPKSQKENEDANIKILCEYFNISRAKAKMYLEFVSGEDLKKINADIDSKYKGRL